MIYPARRPFPVIVAFVVTAAVINGGSGRAEEMQHFITRSGDQLKDGDKPFRFISVNIPNLQLIEDAFSFTGKSAWRWPNEFEIEDALESVRQMGGTVVRTYVFSVYRADSDAGK